MPRRARLAILIAAFAALHPRASAAQDVLGGADPMEAFIGRPVVSVTVTLEGVPTTEPALIDLIETRVGQPLGARDVRDSIAHLFSLGRFEDVRVYAAPGSAGVGLRIELLPVHAVGKIAFTGAIALDEGLLRRAITDRFGASPSAARVNDVVQALTAVYRDHGYLKPRIEPRTVVEHREERTTLTFDIDAGPQLTVSKVSFDGNAPGSLAQAEAQLGLVAGQPYDRPRITARIASYIANLRRHGYYEAQAEHVLRNVSNDGRSAELAVHVDGGARIIVEFQGDPVPPKVRADLVPIEREVSVDEDLLEDSARALTDYFRGQGYRDADVTYTRSPGENELAIVFHVTRGPLYRVGRLEISGNAHLPLATIAPLIRAREGEPFVQSQLDADVEGVVSAYRRVGYPDAKVQSAIVPEPGPGPVNAVIRLAIQEGPRVVLGTLAISGNTRLSEAQLREGVRSAPGQPFYQPQLALDRDGILLKYLNLGYRNADVEVRVDFTPDRSRANVRFEVREGQQVFVDHVLVVGNERTKADTVRREIVLHPGDPLGFEGVAETQRRISALGLFRRVRITEIDHGSAGSRDLLVTVEEAPSTTIGYGGGVEVSRRLVRTSTTDTADERLEFAPRGFVEIGRRNLFGRNRSVNLFTRVSLRTRGDSVVTRDGVQPATDFNEYRVVATYRQPRIFGTTDFLASAFVEQGARTSFDFNRRGARAELARRLGPQWSLSGRYALERSEVFNETFSEEDEDQVLIDRLFPQVRLSSVSSSLIRDTRDDPLGPSHGTLFGIDSEVAARSIGSEVGFVKSFVQGFAYRRLPGRRGTVFAAGVRLGLAAGFSREVPEVGPDNRPVLGPDGETVLVRVDDLPASERFFAGGDTTVRGFGLDQLGTPETLDANGFPRGGNSVLVLNGELRVPVWHDVGVVAFLDGGNVFRRIENFDLGEVRGAVGFGLRYRSPIGPLRFDLGFKLDRRVLPSGRQERPTALHISLGQAF
jgi:outer membrane protein insertion porin family